MQNLEGSIGDTFGSGVKILRPEAKKEFAYGRLVCPIFFRSSTKALAGISLRKNERATKSLSVRNRHADGSTLLLISLSRRSFQSGVVLASLGNNSATFTAN